MTSKTKLVIGLVYFVIAVAIFGAYYFPQVKSQMVGAVSSAGTTNSSRSIASIAVTPLLGSATTTYLLNNGASDRAITSNDVMCTGVGTSNTFLTGTGLANWILQGATTTAAGQAAGTGLGGNTNYAINDTLSTTSASANYFAASSTEGVLQYTSRIWPVNTYLALNFNATNTAACTIVTNYIAL